MQDPAEKSIQEKPGDAQRPGHLRAVETPPAPSKPKKRRSSAKKAALTEEFFREQQAHSAVKARIIASYFTAWARIMKPRARSGKMAYIDLYAGKGMYDDGTPSTPILILNTILADEKLREMVVTIFGDESADCVEALRANIAALPEIASLKYKPQVGVGAAHESGITEQFAVRSVVPTFMFLDPFGYHGLSVGLIRSILKDWGCEVAFFFSFNRIRGAILNDVVREEMDAIFGTERVDALRELLPTLKNQKEKEDAILAALEESLNAIGGNFVLTFRFRNEDGRATHHIVFVTKNDVAYDIMKDIMARESSGKPQDVSIFEFCPNASIPLFEMESPLDDLKRDLLQRYRGQTMSISEIYKQHNYKTRYIKRNYQKALEQLFYDDGLVSAARGQFSPALNPAKRSMPFENTFITFDKD
jgi:three-Cys-motif partner protein